MAALREDIVHLQVAVDQSMLADSISRYSSRLAVASSSLSVTTQRACKVLTCFVGQGASTVAISKGSYASTEQSTIKRLSFISPLMTDAPIC